MNNNLLIIERDFALFRELKNELTEECKEFCQNKSLPIEPRWKVFKEACKHGVVPNHNRWIDHTLDKDISQALGVPPNMWTWYDDFYKDRYAEVRWVEVVDIIEEDKGDMPELKEAVLQHFEEGFTNDW